jgi:hypothetical protein
MFLNGWNSPGDFESNAVNLAIANHEVVECE